MAYRTTADRGLAKLAKGDSIIAEGYVRIFTIEQEGKTLEAEEFVAKRIGHDLSRTNYDVDRARRTSAVREAPSAHSLHHPSSAITR